MSSLESTNNFSFYQPSMPAQIEEVSFRSKEDKEKKAKQSNRIEANEKEASIRILESSSSSGIGSSSSFEDSWIDCAIMSKHCSTDTTLDEEDLRFFQETLSNMRRHIPELCEEEVDMYNIQSFVTSIYHGQISAVATIAQKNLEERGEECPIGDSWCILGLGSLGRGDVNPYSDLDFAILVRVDSDETRQYFSDLVTEMANIVNDFNDEGMHVCKGNTAPSYKGIDGFGGLRKMGSKDLIGTPRTLARNAMDKIMDPSSPGINTNAYSLMQVSFVHGDQRYARRFMRTQRTRIKQQLDNREAKYHFRDVDINRKNSHSPSPYTAGQAMGKRLLTQGIEFWRGIDTINLLQHGPEMADQLPWNIPPRCDIKKAILRPIQNSALGLAIYHGIYEPNPIKAIDRLIENGAIEKQLGKEVQELYKAACGIRIRLELETQTEKTLVTRCPDHKLCEIAGAQVISDEEFALLLEAVDTLDQLRIVAWEYLN